MSAMFMRPYIGTRNSKAMVKHMNRLEKLKGSVLPYYGVAALWLLLIVFGQTDRVVLAMELSVALFLFLRLFGLYSGVQPCEKENELQENTSSHSEQILQKCTLVVQSLDYVKQQIQSMEVRGKVSQLEELSGKILNEVRERPEKLSKISTFVNYYVPTTINILNAYRRAEATGIEGENISKTKKQIESMLDSSILVVFHKQLDSLFGADALDISLELSVLEEMMIREGIAGEKLEAQTLKAGDGSDIRLTL